MATQNLIQKLDPGLGSATAMNRSVSEYFLAGGSIGAGDWVTWDTSKTDEDRALYVIEAVGVSTHGNSRAFGVAKSAASAGQPVEVVVAGYAEGANVNTSTALGDLLVGPIGTAGEAAIFVAGTTEGRIIGVALEADTAGKADVIVFGLLA